MYERWWIWRVDGEPVYDGMMIADGGTDFTGGPDWTVCEEQDYDEPVEFVAAWIQPGEQPLERYATFGRPTEIAVDLTRDDLEAILDGLNLATSDAQRHVRAKIREALDELDR